MIKKTTLFAIILLKSFTVNAQVETVIKEAIQSGLKEGTSILLNQGKIDSVLLTIEKYRADSIADIRLRSYELLDFIARNSENKRIVRKCIELITKAQFDKIFMIRSVSSGYLKNHKSSDYTSISIATISGLTMAENTHLLYFENILLLGFLNVHSLLLDSLAYQKYNSYPAITESNVWGSKLAVARMGNQNVSKECIKLMQMGIMDDFNYYARVCGYLAYIRDNNAINLLYTLLNKQNLMPPLKRESNFQEPFASFALRALKKILINMPRMGRFEPYGQYTMGEIVEARKWMKKNRNNYIINTENF